MIAINEITSGNTIKKLISKSLRIENRISLPQLQNKERKAPHEPSLGTNVVLPTGRLGSRDLPVFYYSDSLEESYGRTSNHEWIFLQQTSGGKEDRS